MLQIPSAGARAAFVYKGFLLIGLLIEKWLLYGCTMPEREIVVFNGVSSQAKVLLHIYFRSVSVNATLGAVRLAHNPSGEFSVV